MSGYQLHNTLNSKTEVCYEPYVYNEPLFLRTNNDYIQYHFYWINVEQNEAHAHVAYSVVDNIAYSPHKLPFGGIEVSRKLSEDNITEFLQEVEQALKDSGITGIRLHQAPSAYFDHGTVSKSLLNEGYEVIQHRVFHFIEVNESGLFHRMHKMEQRKIKKCIDAGAEFKELKKSKKVQAFEWIDRFRTLGYKPPSMTWTDLTDLNKRNPKMYKVFGVFMDGHMLAATVVVIVNKKIAYHFMPASHVDFQDYRKFSPMVFLVENLYKWCQENSIVTLDLGTSYVEMKMKTSLAQFKENIGGKPSEGLSWQKTLTS